MKLSEGGAGLLADREGIRLVAYKDTKGIWTIGVGDTDTNNDGVRDVTEGQTLTLREVIDNFKEDCKWAEEAVNKTVKVKLTQNQYDALVSFIFNIGETAWNKSTMLRKLNRNDPSTAGEFDRWVFPKEITSRRKGEKHQFLAQPGDRLFARIKE